MDHPTNLAHLSHSRSAYDRIFTVVLSSSFRRWENHRQGLRFSSLIKVLSSLLNRHRNRVRTFLLYEFLSSFSFFSAFFCPSFLPSLSLSLSLSSRIFSFSVVALKRRIDLRHLFLECPLSLDVQFHWRFSISSHGTNWQKLSKSFFNMQLSGAICRFRWL